MPSANCSQRVGHPPTFGHAIGDRAASELAAVEIEPLPARMPVGQQVVTAGIGRADDWTAGNDATAAVASFWINPGS